MRSIHLWQNTSPVCCPQLPHLRQQQQQAQHQTPPWAPKHHSARRGDVPSTRQFGNLSPTRQRPRSNKGPARGGCGQLVQAVRLRAKCLTNAIETDTSFYHIYLDSLTSLFHVFSSVRIHYCCIKCPNSDPQYRLSIKHTSVQTRVPHDGFLYFTRQMKQTNLFL